MAFAPTIPNKPLSRWTESEVVAAVASVPALSRELDQARNVILGEHISGEYLERNELTDAILSRMFSNGARRKRFKAQVQKWRQKLSNGIQVRTSSGNTAVFSDRRVPVIGLDMAAQDIRLVIERHFGLTPNQCELMDVRGRHLVEDNTLRQNGLSWGSEIFVELSPRTIPSDVARTDAPDMITQESLPRQPRARMTCNANHGMTADSMALHVKDCMRRHQFEVYCPDPDCRKLWNWDFCLKVASFDRRTRARIEKQRETNLEETMVTVKNCPSCGAPVSKNPGVRNSRVRCPMNCGSDMCWRCLQPWTNGGFGFCGNEGCDTQILERAPIYAYPGNPNVKFPTARSCPRCETLVVHRDACKHVHCSGCSLKFCMSCLKPYLENGGGWQCGSYSDPCEMAPKGQS